MDYVVNSPGSGAVQFPKLLKNEDSLTLNNTSTGRSGTVISWEVPYKGEYEIEAFGARGGAGGYGARMRGKFELERGDLVRILIGQIGSENGEGGGGGGGSFVWINGHSEPLIAAGGGGGRGDGRGGVSAVISTSGTRDSANDSYTVGGTGGHGGRVTSGNSRSGSGGGFKSSGSGAGAFDGQGILSGGTGGINGSMWGGFGGGGAPSGNTSDTEGGGGGGGYSGGAGSHGSPDGGGGGGGSYNAGTDQSNAGSANYGHGRVIIKAVNISTVIFENMQFSETSIGSDEKGEITFQSDLRTVDSGDQVTPTNEEVLTILSVAGMSFMASGMTPYTAVVGFPKELLKPGSNKVEIVFRSKDTGSENYFLYDIRKEDRDTFVYLRRMEYDASHIPEGNIEFISGLGYELSGKGDGILLVSIPSQGKSNIEKITIDATPSVEGKEIAEFNTENQSWTLSSSVSKTRVNLNTFIDTLIIRPRR